MKNKTIITLCILFVVLTLLTGCSNNNKGTQAARKITGTDGIAINIEGKNNIELFGNYDTSEVYQISIENKGKYDILDNEFYGEITLKDGLKQNEENIQALTFNSFSEFNEYQTNYLEGVNQNREKGDFITKVISLDTNVPSGQGITSGFDIKTCYKYETIFSETICINSIRNEKQQNCKKNEYNFNSGQGAPIKISKVEVSDKIIQDNLVAPRLLITIENTKKQIATLPSEFTGGCTGEGNLNKIKLTTAKLGQQTLSCKLNDEMIDLSKNTQTVICDLDDNPNIDFGDSFDTVLYIVLEYGYSESKSFNIDITRK